MSLHSSMSLEAIFNRMYRDQSTGAPIDADAKARNAFILELAMENMKAEKLAASLPDLAGMFREVANMTAEEEAELNANISAQREAEMRWLYAETTEEEEAALQDYRNTYGGAS
jgi:hypothetical protein